MSAVSTWPRAAPCMRMWLFSPAVELLIPVTGTHRHSLFRFQDIIHLSYRVCVKNMELVASLFPILEFWNPF